MHFKSMTITLVLYLSASAPVFAHPGAHPQRLSQAVAPVTPAATLDALGTANAFAAALVKGDAAAALSLLAENVVIYEYGGQESSRDEYAAHHLQLDIAFLAGMKIQVLDREQGGNDEVAWVITRSRFTGTHKGKRIDWYSTESLVLQRSPQGWKIVHVHWSSRPVEPKSS